MTPHPISISKEEQSLIVAALPQGVDRSRRALLPRILHEWVHVDLPEHLDWEARRRRTKTRQRRLFLVKKRATELVTFIQELNAEDQFLLATKLTARRTQKQILDLDRDQIAGSVAELLHKTEWLLELAAGANDALSSITRSRGPPRAVAHYLIMMDLAAIFEYLTCKRATRSVRGKDHFEHGAEYGPFWDFARATWSAIFKSTDGLKFAIKNWAGARDRYGEASPLIANVHLRHPEWRLFGK